MSGHIFFILLDTFVYLIKHNAFVLKYTNINIFISVKKIGVGCYYYYYVKNSFYLEMKSFIA